MQLSFFQRYIQTPRKKGEIERREEERKKITERKVNSMQQTISKEILIYVDFNLKFKKQAKLSYFFSDNFRITFTELNHSLLQLNPYTPDIVIM